MRSRNETVSRPSRECHELIDRIRDRDTGDQTDVSDVNVARSDADGGDTI